MKAKEEQQYKEGKLFHRLKFTKSLLIFDVESDFLAELAIVGLEEVFEIVFGAFGNAFGVMLDAMLDVVLK